jgi:glucan phosphorylase
MMTEAATQLAPVISEARTVLSLPSRNGWSLVRNLWWSWDQDSISLFLDLDSARWRHTGRTHSNMDVHDSRDGEDLYRTLREEVIPLYYQRDRDGLPHGWIKCMKRTIRTLGSRFNADRMVMDYTLKC